VTKEKTGLLSDLGGHLSRMFRQDSKEGVLSKDGGVGANAGLDKEHVFKAPLPVVS
jgi:hypothetical protein